MLNLYLQTLILLFFGFSSYSKQKLIERLLHNLVRLSHFYNVQVSLEPMLKFVNFFLFLFIFIYLFSW